MIAARRKTPVRPEPSGLRLAELAKRLAPAPMPSAVSPMLCTLVAEPFDSPDWIFEPKYDGLRIIGRFDGRNLTLLSRNQQPQNFPFPDIVAALRESLDGPAIVDGEVVCLDEQGRSSFRSLQQRFHLKDRREVETRMRQHPAFLYLFDLLYLDRYDLTGLPLRDRKPLLQQAVRWSDRIRPTPFVQETGTASLQQACREGAEGIIGKHLDSRYVSGRSASWVKLKCIGRQEFVIGGFTEPQRSRVGLGALLVGYYSDDGQRLIYAGKVGTGYTNEVLLDLRHRLDRIEQRQSPFAQGTPPRGSPVHWVKPQLVAEIAFGEWTQNGRLRQPRFEGLRHDKSPHECRRERPKVVRPAPDRVTSKPDSGDPAMTLEKYRQKRDFHATPEPSARIAARRNPDRAIFVVQEHHASHLHYDFRLEADGVLKSWAVPKTPSTDPTQKRLAVQVEDHPLAYAKFEGTIPEGQYGAGTVHIWDKGTYDNLLAEKARPQTIAEGIEAGKLEFVLHGDRLRGRFALIRMHGKQRGKVNWLLIKAKDEFARPGDEPPQAVRTEVKTGTKGNASSPRTRSRRGSEPNGHATAFSHLDKVWFPDSGITKGDVIEYYRRIAPRLLPYLRDRPVTLERLPDGLNGDDSPHFWQKNTPAFYPDWIPRVELPSERGKPVSYVLVNDEPTLLYLVNQGTMTFHVGFSRLASMDRPDFVLFDLDPGRASFADAVAVARKLHTILEAEGIKSYVKTSGKTGLHVLIRWQGAGDHDEARGWALGIAERAVEAMPEQATVERSKAKRGARVYVDVMQNAKGHHAVPPFVLRAVPGASVSMPLNWRALTPDLDPASYNLRTIIRRLSEQKRDPMAGLLQGLAHPVGQG